MTARGPLRIACMPRSASAWDRWLNRVEIGDCWQWLGAVSSSGYGALKVEAETGSGLRTVSVHRWVWEQLVGPIPPPLVIDHLCRNKLCCNPDHLRTVTQRANLAAGYGLAWRVRRDGKCPRGHPWIAANMYWSDAARTRQSCRACRDMREAARRG